MEAHLNIVSILVQTNFNIKYFVRGISQYSISSRSITISIFSVIHSHTLQPTLLKALCTKSNVALRCIPCTCPLLGMFVLVVDA